MSYSGEPSISQTHNANRKGGVSTYYVAEYFPKNWMKWKEGQSHSDPPIMWII